MQATVLYGERDIRFEDRPEPTIVEASDAIIRLPVTGICGSDLWPYRGIQARIKQLTKGVGADSVLECVGTQESMMQAIKARRVRGLRRRAAWCGA